MRTPLLGLASLVWPHWCGLSAVTAPTGRIGAQLTMPPGLLRQAAATFSRPTRDTDSCHDAAALHRPRHGRRHDAVRVPTPTSAGRAEAGGVAGGCVAGGGASAVSADAPPAPLAAEGHRT
ncbi:hypothetical protein [Streptomyces sp. NBC_00316]|uniref:hypothetical protein n=1 Tax=Streptomyces sp. NBC_00316 TaxID=2975710 RepID=UPI002E2BFD6C|nr:hypothetical protein [Streptomyces sp. NBC_00316]